MTVKVEAYPEMSYHQRFPSSSNGVALNGYTDPRVYDSRPYETRPPYDSRPYYNAPSFDPHSSSVPNNLTLRNGSRIDPARLDPHSSSYNDVLTIQRNGTQPRGAPPAFTSATLNRGLRRADQPLPRTSRNGQPPATVTYRSYSSAPNGNGSVNLHRFPSQNHRIQASNTLQPSRRSSTATVTNPERVIWSASPNGNGSGGSGRPTVVLRKPRSRRLLRSLLCCFGAKPHSSPGDRRDGSPLKNDVLPPSSPYLPKPSEKLLLPPTRPVDGNKKCLIIDLDETLVHSSFKPVKNADFVIPVEIDGVIHQVYVLKRPYVDEFLDRIGDIFECILFTASLAKYADPVADLLDKRGVFRTRLFREACVFHKGNYVKDLNRLGRDLKKVLIVDNSPASYAFHPDNAIPVQSWFDDMSDTELLDLLPILERMVSVDNVYSVLRNANDHP